MTTVAKSKAWTHWVMCAETALWSPHGEVKARLDSDGIYRMCERRIPGMEYDMPLTVDFAIRKEDWTVYWPAKMIKRKLGPK